jgi:flavin reductase (DIM6/NTAB) family NADH-FMN oxidoreductase RutF
MDLDPTELNRDALYRIGTSSIVPRPIGWLSTCDADGVENLAPFSSFNYVSHDPLVVMFTAGVRDDGNLPDTARNAIETGELVFNLVTEDLLEAMHRTGESIPSDESEFERFGIERAASTRVTPPRVASAKVHFECRLHDTYEFEHGRTMVMAEAVHVHVDDDALTGGDIDATKTDPAGRAGGPNYTSIPLVEPPRLA